MAVLDHWHPVMLSRDLRQRPVAVRLAGKDIVLFRGNHGQVGALLDHCPHRRMRLSVGKVVDDRLQCRYHGWSFDCDGAGKSPGTPALCAKADAFEAVERHEAVWVRSAAASTVFPSLDVDGYFNICNLHHTVKAPLELVVDNFCEIEHTPTTHAFFGYPLERMDEVRVDFQTSPDSVRVINCGPSKKINLLLRLLLGITPRFEFHDDWTTFFSPVYSCYDHWWADPVSGRQSRVCWRLFIFFVPIDEQYTSLTTLAYIKSSYPFGPVGGVRPFTRLMRTRLDHEIRLDIEILENLADYDTSIEGMKLSRFDKVLGLNRDRIRRVYYGQPQLVEQVA